MLKWTKRILALLFTISILLFLIGGFGYLVVYSKGYNAIKIERWKLANNKRIGFVSDSTLMYRPKANAQYSWFELTNNLADTNKIFTIDSLQRRITPHDNSKSKHALFFGCSYTYGDGLSDENSFPYLFSKRDTIYNAYNYAVSGYGTAHMLELLKRDLQSQIPEKNGVGLYFFIDHHKDRIVNDPYTLDWGYDFPRYTLDEDLNLIYEGTFFERGKVRARFWKGFARYKLWKILIGYQKIRNRNVNKEDTTTSITNLSSNQLKLEFANQIELKGIHDHKYLLMSKIIKAAENEYLKQFPKGKFYVVVLPGESTEVIRFLEYMHLKHLNLSNAIDLNKIKGRQQDGYHPNEIGADAIADLLQSKLDGITEIY